MSNLEYKDISDEKGIESDGTNSYISIEVYRVNKEPKELLGTIFWKVGQDEYKFKSLESIFTSEELEDIIATMKYVNEYGRGL